MPDALDKQIDSILGVGSAAPADSAIESQIDSMLGSAPAKPVAGQQILTAKPAEEEGLGRFFGLARNAVVGGLATGLGAPGTAVQAVFGPAADPTTNPLITDTFAQGGYGTLPTIQQLQSLAGKAGLLNATSLTPGAGAYPNLERYGTGALSGAASAVPLVAMVGPEAAPWLIAQGAAGGVAGEGARQIDPNSVWGPPIAGALAGGLVQGGRNLWAGDPLKGVARSLGTSETPDQAGGALQAAFKDWRNSEMNMDNASNKMNIAAAPLDAGIPAEASASATPLMDRINEMLAFGGAKARAIKGFLNSTEKDGGFLGSIAKKFNDSLAEASLSNSEPVPPDLSWAEGRALRTELGTTLSTARPAERPALEYTYGGSSEHLGQIAAQHDLGPEFANFNKISTDMHNLDAGPVEDILSASTAGGAYTRALVGSNKSGETIAALRSEAPGAVDQLASAVLNYAPQQWKKMSPEAKEALIPDPAMRNAVESGLSASPAAASPLARGIGHISGMQLGDLLGMAIAHKFGVNPLEAGAYGGLGLGYLMPTVGTVGRTVGRPNILGAEAVGAVGGESRLPAQSPTP